MCSADLYMEKKRNALYPSSLFLFLGGAVRLLLVMGYFTSVVSQTLITLTPDGQGEISNKSRPLKPGEVGEWILLDGVGPIPRAPSPFPDYAGRYRHPQLVPTFHYIISSLVKWTLSFLVLTMVESMLVEDRVP